jgi:hypothetical protein
MAIQHWLSAWKTDEFRVPPEFGPGGETQHMCNTRNINHPANNACPDVFGLLDADCYTSLPQVQAKTMDNICSMIRRRIHSAGTDTPMAQPPKNQCSFDEEFLDYVPEELIE